MISKRTGKAKAKGRAKVRTKRGTKALRHPFLPQKSKRPTKLSCRVWKWPDEEETGYCGNCAHCLGVDEKKDVCKCSLKNPHRDWRYNDNEACPDWELL